MRAGVPTDFQTIPTGSKAYSAFGQTVRFHRNQKGFGLNEFADSLGVSLDYWSRVEREGTVRRSWDWPGEGGLKAFGHEHDQPVSHFQDVARDHPPGGDDASAVHAVAAECGGFAP